MRTREPLALLTLLLALEAHGAPALDRFGAHRAIARARGGRGLVGREVRVRQLTQTVFETLVQTATATTYTTVSASGEGVDGYGSSADATGTVVYQSSSDATAMGTHQSSSATATTYDTSSDAGSATFTLSSIGLSGSAGSATTAPATTVGTESIQGVVSSTGSIPASSDSGVSTATISAAPLSWTSSTATSYSTDVSGASSTTSAINASGSIPATSDSSASASTTSESLANGNSSTATTYSTDVSGSNAATSSTAAPVSTNTDSLQPTASPMTMTSDTQISSSLPDTTSDITSLPTAITPPAPTSISAPALTSPPTALTSALLPGQDAESAHPSTTPKSTPAPSPVAKPLMMAYYPDWTSSSFPPEKVDFSRYDWVDFAFAVPLADFSLGWDGADNDPDVLKRLVAKAHQGGKKVKVSVGGWTGSKYFSSAVATPQSRQTFANNILKMYTQFNIDGIDIDWEFPGQAGADGNGESANDTANYLAFLQLLRKTLPAQAKITAATMTVPWADASGNPLKDVSAFAQVLDWILIMNYDTWGSSNPPGPNAPLSNACHNSTQNSQSAVAGVAAWTAAGFPANKIVLGVPSYGYISTSSSNYLTTRSRVTRRHVPMHLDGPSSGTLGPEAVREPLVHPEGTTGATMVKNEDGGTQDGQVQFRDLVAQGILQYLPAWTSTRRDVDDADGQDSGSSDSDSDSGDDSASDSADTSDSDSSDPDNDTVSSTTLAPGAHAIDSVFTALRGFERRWDACSSSPYLRSAAARQVVTYDDPQSLEMKATYARYAGLLGVNMFDVHGDTDAWDLTDGVRRGLGL